MKDKLPNPLKKKLVLKIAILAALAAITIHFFQGNGSSEKTKLPSVQTYTALLSKIDREEISELTIKERGDNTKSAIIVGKNGLTSQINVPNDDNGLLITKAIKNNVAVTVDSPPQTSSFWSWFLVFGPVALLGGIIIWSVLAQRRDQRNMRNGMGVSENKSKLIDPNDIKVSFKDVIGCDNAKEEVAEVVDFLKIPEKFTKAGAKIPRGVLLVGPAGTGKTLLAKAIAKESNVPFFSTSGSEFMEMFVGVGPARVRHMFEQAKEVAPSVIFIDEIDAIGGKRGINSSQGGNSEREQTLNQILVELDGIDTNKTVILIAATNRPEMLDDALLRPGRIDRQVNVDLPDVKGREEMLNLYAKNIPLHKDVKISNIAMGTPGFSGAELANLVNEAAIFAVRKNSQFVHNIHFEEAKSKIMMGLERPNLSMTEVEKRETAYHESGHAVVARLLAANGGSDPVHKVTIIPRGRALGVTLQLPEKERYSHDMNFLKNRITILMGGRAAEEIFCSKRTTGASNDIQVATSTATSMVCEWGMSKMGPIALGQRNGGQFLGGSSFDIKTLSSQSAVAVEKEIHELLNGEYEHAMKLLTDNRDIMEAMTQALMEVETIDEWQIDNLMARRHYNDPIGRTEYEKRYNKKFLGTEVIEEPEIIDGESWISSVDGLTTSGNKKPEVEATPTPPATAA